MSTTEPIARVHVDARGVATRAQDRSGDRVAYADIHNVVHKLSLYRSTGAIGVR